MATVTKAEPSEDREILIVDDDPGQRSLLTTFLSGQGFQTTTVDSGEAAIGELSQRRYRLMISDVRMPGISGLETLRQARALHPNLPVLLVTAYADVKDAVGAMKDGAVNYLEKPIDLDELAAFARSVVRTPTSTTAPTADKPAIPEAIVATSDATRQIYCDALLVAPSDSPVLITGESGTGKALTADLIHRASRRATQALERINCAVHDTATLDTMLWGSEDQPGLLATTNEGTLVLDEIGELPLELQAKLLAFMVDGTILQSGKASPQKSRTRLIVTSKGDLGIQTNDGSFRDDLYFRLNVIELALPPLRDRQEDTLPLATAFIKEYTQGHARFADTVKPCLERYHWPGNIRELRNAMERATLMAHGGIILPKHLPAKVQAAAQSAEQGESQQIRKMADVERETILKTLADNRNNRSVTARVLGISRRALTYKLQKYRADGYLSESD